MLSAVCGYLTSSSNDTNVCIVHIPKSYIHLSSTLKGLTPDGRYIHRIKNGRATYHPGYYTIDGRLLQPHI
jgi:hypothetical protein